MRARIGADFLLCSAYKFYGPHIGVCYGRHEATAALDLPRLEPAPDYVPECLETGTQNHEGIVGAAAAVEFLASLAPDGGADRRGSPGGRHAGAARARRGAVRAAVGRTRRRSTA